jgi:hypothetical protein
MTEEAAPADEDLQPLSVPKFPKLKKLQLCPSAWTRQATVDEELWRHDVTVFTGTSRMTGDWLEDLVLGLPTSLPSHESREFKLSSRGSSMLA